MSYHGKLQVLKNGTADAEIQLWAYQQLEKELSLTDEEIESWITEWAKDLYGSLYVEPTDHQRTMAIKMARAILRKAQEK